MGMDHEEALWLINHTSQVDKLTFKVIVIFLSCLALIASACRLTFRFRSDRTLHKDDALVFLATICLIAETCTVYYSTPALYVITAREHIPPETWTVITRAASEEVDRVSNFSFGWFKAYYTLAWCTIWVVKFSFLALFFRMVRKLKKSLTVWYWITFSSTVVAGIVVLVVESFLCNQPTLAANGSCLIKDTYMLFIGKDITCTVLDIFTDLMIISIPLFILRMSQLSLDHKLRIAMILWLSCVCIVLSILRIAGGIKGNSMNCVWLTFILHCESAVAVMAGSMPALRALYRSRCQNRRTLLASESRSDGDVSSRKSRVMSKIRRTRGSRLSGIPEQGEEGNEGDEQPIIAQPQRQPTSSSSPPEKDLPEPPPAKSASSRSSLQFLTRLPSLRRINLCPNPTFLSAAASSNSPMIPILSPPPPIHSGPSTSTSTLPPIPLQINVTCECTVHSEEASLHDMPSFQEIGQREWVWDEERAVRGREGRGWEGREVAPAGCSTQVNSRVEEERIQRIAEDPMMRLDPALLGRITSGMHI